DRTVSAALIADEAGVITPIAAARETAEELGLVVEHAVDEASVVAAGDEILRFRGHPLQIALADERLVGVLAKPSGIATAARRFVERANGRPRVVSGASKKLPFAQKDMIRAAIVTGGAQPRIAEWPFHYLDKNFVTMLGGVEATL